MVFLGASILLGGLFVTVATQRAQSQTTVTNTWIAPATSTQTSTVTSAATEISYTTQTSTVEIVGTETYTGMSGIFLGSTTSQFYVSSETVETTSAYTQILPYQQPMFLTYVSSVTQSLTQTITLAGTSLNFVAALIAPILISIVVFGGAYMRVHAYRTRLHIYHEILQYVAESPRVPSHIMRRCNLETRKFSKYISTLGERGFVERIHGDGERYKVTDKAREYLRDEKLSAFIKELP